MFYQSLLSLCVSRCPCSRPLLCPGCVPPFGCHSLEFLPLPVRHAPDLLTVLLHPLEVAVADQLHEILVPELWGGWSGGQAGEGAGWRSVWRIAFIFLAFMQQTLNFPLIQHLQSDTHHRLDEAVLCGLAHIDPCVSLRYVKEQQAVGGLNHTIIAFYLKERNSMQRLKMCGFLGWSKSNES